MFTIISTLFDALISKVLPRVGVPVEITDTAQQIRDDSYDSLVKYTRVEPFCIIDNTLVGLPYTEALYGASLNILIGYYLQAVSLINSGNGIPPIKMLRRLSPEGGVLASESLNTESFYMGMLNGTMTTEATNRSGQLTRGKGRPYNHRNTQPDQDDTDTHAKRVNIMEVKKSNAVVGKILTIDFDNGKRVMPINVNVRYDIIETPAPLIVDYLSTGSPDKSFAVRLRQLRAGKIKFWSDFIFATDLLEQQKKLMLMDKNGVIKSIIERRGKGLVNSASGGGRNYGISSNCLIVSSSTMKQAEGILKGNIDNERVRNNIFSELSLLLLIVVDKEYERFTFYFRNKPHPTTVSLKVLKSGLTSDKEDNLESLAKALGGNRPVTF